MERTDHQVTCDRCRVSEPRRSGGPLPLGWDWIILRGPAPRSRLLCEACVQAVVAFIDHKEIQP